MFVQERALVVPCMGVYVVYGVPAAGYIYCF